MIKNKKGIPLFVRTGENGYGRLTSADRPDAFVRDIGRMLGLNRKPKLYLLVKHCGLPTLFLSKRRSSRMRPQFSIAATREWMMKQEEMIYSGAEPTTLEHLYLCDLYERRPEMHEKMCAMWAERRRIERAKKRAVREKYRLARKEAWMKIKAAGVARETVENLKYYHRHATVRGCARGSVCGDHMLQCAREALMDKVQGRDKRQKGKAEMMRTALRAVDEAGLAFSIGDAR